jgi:hypothetical protein
MQQMGVPLFLNEQDAARYTILKQRHAVLVKQLYQMMKTDNDV